MTGEVTPQSVAVDELVDSMTRSLVAASESVRGLTGADAPHIYVMADMEVTINLSFTYEKGKVKGILGRSRESQSQQVDSSLHFRLAVVPRPVPQGTPVTPNLGPPTLPPSSTTTTPTSG